MLAKLGKAPDARRLGVRPQPARLEHDGARRLPRAAAGAGGARRELVAFGDDGTPAFERVCMRMLHRKSMLMTMPGTFVPAVSRGYSEQEGRAPRMVEGGSELAYAHTDKESGRMAGSFRSTTGREARGRARLGTLPSGMDRPCVAAVRWSARPLSREGNPTRRPDHRVWGNHRPRTARPK